MVDNNQSSTAAPPQVQELPTSLTSVITSPDFKPNGRCDARITKERALGQPYRGMWKKKKQQQLD